MSDPRNLPIARELKERGIRPSRRLGQNFMVDRQMLDFLVRTAGLRSDDVILEIGAGAGFLTERLCRSARCVVSVEIDKGLYALAAERLAGFGNLQLIHADALASEHLWNPPVTEALKKAVHERPGALKMVANLPYSVATACVQAVFESDLPFVTCTFTCQKEVAERLAAGPGDSEYGFISVITALLADICVVRSLPPSVFWPRPKVESAIVDLRMRPRREATMGDPLSFRRVVSLLFSQRRKTLRSALKALGIDYSDIIGEEGGPKDLPAALDERIFRLSPRRFAELANVLGGVL